MWWQPWTWHRLIASTTSRSPEFTRRDVELALALEQVDAETDPISGLPMSVVTDPANEFRFVTEYPTVNWAARTLDADQRKYYAPLDKAAADAKEPAPSRAGHMWRVKLPEPK